MNKVSTKGCWALHARWAGLILLGILSIEPVVAQTQAAADSTTAQVQVEPTSPAPGALPAPQTQAASASSETGARVEGGSPESPRAKRSVFSISQDLSAWGMFQGAVPVVKAVMIGLALASLLTWTIWIAKTTEFVQRRRKLKVALTHLSQASALNDVPSLDDTAVADMLSNTANELGKCGELIRNGLTEGLKERVALRLQRIEAAAVRRMGRSVGILASISSTAPFVGLFGTVWGIMHSFVNIAEAQTTSLSVVAPGIAEALLATALGLVAAIPAAVMYNVFARSLAGYRANLADCSTLIMCLLSSEIDHRTLVPAEKPRAVAAGR